MNYNGNNSLKVGSEKVQGKGYLDLNLNDQAGQDKPWKNLMIGDQDDT